jgi:hypothetical protein
MRRRARTAPFTRSLRAPALPFKTVAPAVWSGAYSQTNEHRVCGEASGPRP